MIHKLSIIAALFAITGYVSASIQLKDQTKMLSEVEQNQNRDGTRPRMRVRAVCNFGDFSGLSLTQIDSEETEKIELSAVASETTQNDEIRFQQGQDAQQSRQRDDNNNENVRGRIVFIQEGRNDRDINVRIHLRGLRPFRRYGIAIHESGNVRNQCRNVGDIFNPRNRRPPTGALVTLNANRDGEILTNIRNIDLTITGPGRFSILERSCVVRRPRDQSLERSYSISDSDRSRDVFVDCARIE